jgi:hypothetical protein
MNVQTTAARKCSRCGTAIETCAVCDEPDCPAVTCSRCVSVASVDRLRAKPNPSSNLQR